MRLTNLLEAFRFLIIGIRLSKESGNYGRLIIFYLLVVSSNAKSSLSNFSSGAANKVSSWLLLVALAIGAPICG